MRTWLKTLALQVFPQARISEAARVHDALELTSALRFDVALIDLGLPDGSGVAVVERLRDTQPDAQSVVVTIHDDDEHLFPALQAGAFGYLLKEQSREQLSEQLHRISQGEPPLSPSIARRVIQYFTAQAKIKREEEQPLMPHVQLTDRENDVLLRVAKGFTLPEIGQQLNLSRHTIADYVKQIYRKLNVSSRAEAALEAQRLGLFRRQ
ncbi:MAG: response regulator transcription factor [Aquabacterium sp.]|nr:MAG: response regulator transcription factor [Aquabacterium sp.]